MAYEKQTWTTGEVITQEKLNHMEDGIENAYELPTATETDNGKVLGVEDGAWSVIDGGGLKNLIDGSAEGSVRGINTAAEDSSYTMGGNASAEGEGTKASGRYSHAEGNSTWASQEASHAEGTRTTASASNSHAEGFATRASGDNSHAEGNSTSASGICAHAEGFQASASGSNSHAEGMYTYATHKSQHVFGEYNVKDPSSATRTNRGTYVEIVGNGTGNNATSNARTLDWSGNETLQGSLTLGKGSADETTVTATQLKALIALLNQ